MACGERLDPRFHGSRLTYAPLADAAWALAFFRTPHVRRWLLDDALVDAAWVAGELAASDALFARSGIGLWQLTLRAQPEVRVGVAGYRWFDDTRSYQLLYAIDEAWTRRGFATEAAHALVHHALAAGCMEPAVAGADAPNAASIRVLERCGFTPGAPCGGARMFSVDRARFLTLRTPRVVLRPWTDADREPFAALNADPVVMEHFTSRTDRAGSDAFVDRISRHFERNGFGLWAVELPGVTPFAGFTGLQVTPWREEWIEIGWRLARPYWGAGYVTEAARAVLAFGFARLGLEQIVSMTVPANERSWRVMERIGMTRDPADDFEHPRIAEGSPLRRHVLYRLNRPA